MQTVDVYTPRPLWHWAALALFRTKAANTFPAHRYQNRWSMSDEAEAGVRAIPFLRRAVSVICLQMDSFCRTHPVPNKKWPSYISRHGRTKFVKVAFRENGIREKRVACTERRED